jgi:hypothetical protein
MNYQDIFDTVPASTFRAHSDRSRAHLSKVMTGKKQTAETIAKRVATQKGKPKSEQGRANIAAANILKFQGKPSKIKGRTDIHSAEQRQAISVRKSKPIMTPHGLFPSRAAVAKAAGVWVTTVRDWMKKYPNDFYYVTKGE